MARESLLKGNEDRSGQARAKKIELQMKSLPSAGNSSIQRSNAQEPAAVFNDKKERLQE